MKKAIMIRLALPGVFFISGSAALIYEILWSRQFVTVFGNSTDAISIILCAFMAGLGLGGIFFGRIADRTNDPLRMYALLEVGIGATALMIPFLLDILRAVTPGLIAALPPGLLSVSAVRLVFTFLILFVPCSLMGGTLPVLARFAVDAKEVVGQRIGILYGFNTLGGAFGCGLAGYFLVESLGIAVTGYLAVATNLLIAAAAMGIRHLKGAPAPAPTPTATKPASPATGVIDDPADRTGARILLFVAFLSGFTTLACEVLWVRFLAFVCTSTPYTFTAILCLFLVGLALGSFIYRTFLARITSRFLLLGTIQVAIAVAVVGSLLAGSHFIIDNGPMAQAQILGGSFFEQRVIWPILNTIMFALVPTLVMGIVFPLVCATFTRSLGAVGRSVGLVYGLNTIGCIIGSLAPVFILIRLFGIQGSLVAIALLSVGVGFVLILLSIRRGEGTRIFPMIAAAAAVLIAVTSALTPTDLTRRMFLRGLVTTGPYMKIVHYDEGRTGTSIVIEDKIDNLRGLFINSVFEVPTTYTAVGIFKLMGHLGPLMHPDPRDTLAICFGGGIVGGSLNLHPSVKHLDIVDIEGSVIEAARALADSNNDLHASDKLTTYIDDGRNFLVTCDKQYPLIVSDSTHPKSADSWVLYTVEFYETVAETLDEGGLFIQWIPYHGISEDEFKIIVKTFMEVFPHSHLWWVFGIDERTTLRGYAMITGSLEKPTIDLELLRRRLSVPEVMADLEPYHMETVEHVLRHYVCGPGMLRDWTEGLPVNTDDRPLTQYQSRWSGGPEANYDMFKPILENPWPYLVNVQKIPEAAGMKSRLDTHLKAQDLAIENQWVAAGNIMQDDPKFRMNLKKRVQGLAWQKALRENFNE